MQCIQNRSETYRIFTKYVNNIISSQSRWLRCKYFLYIIPRWCKFCLQPASLCIKMTLLIIKQHRWAKVSWFSKHYLPSWVVRSSLQIDCSSFACTWYRDLLCPSDLAPSHCHEALQATPDRRVRHAGTICTQCRERNELQFLLPVGPGTFPKLTGLGGC